MKLFPEPGPATANRFLVYGVFFNAGCLVINLLSFWAAHRWQDLIPVPINIFGLTLPVWFQIRFRRKYGRQTRALDAMEQSLRVLTTTDNQNQFISAAEQLEAAERDFERHL